MKKTKSIEINGRQMTIAELTVGQVIDAMDHLDPADPHLELMFDDRFPVSLLPEIVSDLKLGDLNVWTPSEIEKLIEEVEKLNPFLSRMYQRLVGMLKLIPPPTGDNVSGISEKPAPGLS